MAANDSAEMSAAGPPKERLLVVGANHRSSSLMLRDRLFVDDGAVPAFLERVRQTGVNQAIVLSTCDRVEIQAADADAEAAAERLLGVMADHAALPRDELDGQVYTHVDADAGRHIFAVVASLDSLVVGETQVLGQVKACHRMAKDAGMCDGTLDRVLQAAYGAAKRVRNETAIGERPVSIAAAAVGIARDLHGDLATCSALLLGSGEMTELMARNLHGAGLENLTVTHPTSARAEAVARTLDCHAASFDDLARLLAGADIVLACVGARSHALTVDRVLSALRQRRRKPMFIIDAALPGDVEPAVNRIDEAFVYDLGDLERVAMEGRETRQAEADAARRIVEAAHDDFQRGRAERQAVPSLSRLRQLFDDERARALAEAGGDAEKATRLLVGRLLHGPSEVLRDLAALAAADGGGARAADWRMVETVLDRVFRLGDDDKEE